MSNHMKLLAGAWLALFLFAPLLALLAVPAVGIIYIRQRYYTQLFLLFFGGLVIWVFLNWLF